MNVNAELVEKVSKTGNKYVLKMNVNAELVEKVSKTGNKYVCIEISLTDKVKKVVFLTDAEVELLKLYLSSSSNK